MQLSSQILGFRRIFYAIKQYMQLSNMQLTVQFFLNGWNWLVVFEVLCD